MQVSGERWCDKFRLCRLPAVTEVDKSSSCCLSTVNVSLADFCQLGLVNVAPILQHFLPGLSPVKWGWSEQSGSVGQMPCFAAAGPTLRINQLTYQLCQVGFIHAQLFCPFQTKELTGDSLVNNPTSSLLLKHTWLKTPCCVFQTIFYIPAVIFTFALHLQRLSWALNMTKLKAAPCGIGINTSVNSFLHWKHKDALSYSGSHHQHAGAAPAHSFWVPLAGSMMPPTPTFRQFWGLLLEDKPLLFPAECQLGHTATHHQWRLLHVWVVSHCP